MTEIVCDACTFILLHKSDLLNQLTEKNTILIPTKVYHEICGNKEKGAAEIYLLDKLIEDNKIIIHEPINSKDIEKLFQLHAGECSAIALAKEKKLGLLTDDRKAMNACKVLNIEFTTALNIAIASKIEKKKALEAVEKLHMYGWYSETLIKRAKEIIGG